MKYVITFFLMSILGVAAACAQQAIPQKIRISEGHCLGKCGYGDGFHDLYFSHILEYTLADSSFRYKKKAHKPFQVLRTAPTDIFTDPNTYVALDSLYQNFTAFTSSRGKFYIYRIELIYHSEVNTMGLPLQIKTMDFVESSNPNRIHPAFLDSVISDYKLIYRSHKKK